MVESAKTFGEQFLENLSQINFPFMAILATIVAILASIHVLLNKRDTRSAVNWVALIWLSPVLGAITYLIFGINRIRRQARKLEGPSPHISSLNKETSEALPNSLADFQDLKLFGDRVLDFPLVGGNLIEPLLDGGQAFPQMLKAIDNAQRSLTLSTYIFDRDEIGMQFVRSLKNAVERGVKVRVLIDALGARYSRPSILTEFRRAKIPYARFLPFDRPWRISHLNLRNHRKILVADGSVGFTGGINIRQGNLQSEGRNAIRDVHFKIQGPIVTQLQEMFVQDWEFSTEESLSGECWFSSQQVAGSTYCRGIPDGPGVHFERLKLSMLGAISSAKKHIRIQTPYFLPDLSIFMFLKIAVNRGVRVELLVPERGNLRFVQWAMNAQLPHMIEAGCEVYLSQGVFDHSKVVVVDGGWGSIGSANWDARSLRLNFEFNVECFDAVFASKLADVFEHKKSLAKPATVSMFRSSGIGLRLRNEAARLFSPYL